MVYSCIVSSALTRHLSDRPDNRERPPEIAADRFVCGDIDVVQVTGTDLALARTITREPDKDTLVHWSRPNLDGYIVSCALTRSRTAVEKPLPSSCLGYGTTDCLPANAPQSSTMPLSPRPSPNPLNHKPNPRSPPFERYDQHSTKIQLTHARNPRHNLIHPHSLHPFLGTPIISRRDRRMVRHLFTQKHHRYLFRVDNARIGVRLNFVTRSRYSLGKGRHVESVFRGGLCQRGVGGAFRAG